MHTPPYVQPLGIPRLTLDRNQIMALLFCLENPHDPLDIQLHPTH